MSLLVNKNFAVATVCIHTLLASRIFHISALNFSTNMSPKLYACDFEVFGIVQGVFFRKYTEKQAKNLGIRGWCMNTSEGTVKGQLEGPLPKLKEMKKWLETTGSPSSRIDKAVFSEEKEIDNYSFRDFNIRR